MPPFTAESSSAGARHVAQARSGGAVVRCHSEEPAGQLGVTVSLKRTKVGAADSGGVGFRCAKPLQTCLCRLVDPTDDRRSTVVRRDAMTGGEDHPH